MSGSNTENNEITKAMLDFNGQKISLNVSVGSEGEKSIDISSLRKETGLITMDHGFMNTGSCTSAITFLDGEKGVLRYRGYPIEDLAKEKSFLETSYLIIHGDLPTPTELADFAEKISSSKETPAPLKKILECFPKDAHPMGVLSSALSASTAFFEDGLESDPTEDQIRSLVGVVMAQTKNIAAYQYRLRNSLPLIDSRDGELDYVSDFYNMMFGEEPSEVVREALNALLILHAEHEQNCSTSAVRLVGSSKANLFASIASGVSALWGPLHGGANQAVIEMLESIHADGSGYKKFIERAKDKSDSFRLMGFGHRVYKNFDPRAKIIKGVCDDVLEKMGVSDPLLDIAKGLEEEALRDSYFVERKLYPNVDFYSGIIYKALGIPTTMFTVMFALGRLPGWLGQWNEMRHSSDFRIGRPRQMYTGHQLRKF